MVSTPTANKEVSISGTKEEILFCDFLLYWLHLFHGNPLELAVLLGSYYGLRRSEIVGLKWEAIDFVQKTITIRHTVTQAMVDGKYTMIYKDRPKTKKSLRTLPLVGPFEAILSQLWKLQAENQKVCGTSYCTVIRIIFMLIIWAY